MARPAAKPKTQPGSGGGGSGKGGGSGLSGAIAQVAAQIEQEKLTQKQNVLTAERSRTQMSVLGIEIAEIQLETKGTSRDIARVRGEKERFSLTDAENTRDLTQQLGEIRAEFNEEKIARERRRLYEFEYVEA